MLGISNEQIQDKILKSLKGNFPVQILDNVESTNLTLKKMAEMQAADGTVIIARQQTAGRGTQGRKFFSPLNDLYMSLLVRPNLDIVKSSYLTVATAVAVVNALKKVLGIKCGIKWVNDIIYKNKKVGGILTEGEMESGSQKLKYAVVGIGLNLAKPKSGFHDEIVGVAGELLSAEITADKYCELVAEIIKNAYRLYQKLGKMKFVRKYQRSSVLKNRNILFAKNGKVHVGQVLGVDKLARLVVKVKGEKIKLCAGEVTIMK